MSKKNKKHLTTKNTQPKKGENFGTVNKFTIPENPLEDLKWLPELTESMEEHLTIVNNLGFGIAVSGLNGSPGIKFIPKLERDEALLQEFINGKWRFMIAACQYRKQNSNRTLEIRANGFDVENIDAALPEIRQRLKCRVWKSWLLNEHFFAVGDDNLFTSLGESIKRVGWSVYPDVPYPEREVSND